MTTLFDTAIARISTWIAARRGVATLVAKSPDQREDLGLTLADMHLLRP